MFRFPAWKVDEKKRRGRRRDDQPSDKEVQRLKGIESNAHIPAVALGGQEYDRRNNPQDRNIAENTSGPIAHPS